MSVVHPSRQITRAGWRQRRHLGALAALAVLGAAPALEIVHLCVVEHSTCPMDGELVDTARVVTHLVATAAPGLREGPAQSSNESHSHHHCTAETRRSSAAGRAALAQHRQTVEDSAASPPLDALLRPDASTPLLHVAPKASPPYDGSAGLQIA
jgi:hypothetical protein